MNRISLIFGRIELNNTSLLNGVIDIIGRANRSNDLERIIENTCNRKENYYDKHKISDRKNIFFSKSLTETKTIIGNFQSNKKEIKNAYIITNPPPLNCYNKFKIDEWHKFAYTNIIHTIISYSRSIHR